MSTEEAQKKYICSSSVTHERRHTKKNLTALAPEFLENGQRDPYNNAGADGGPPVGHFASQDDFDPNSSLGAIRHKRPKMSSVQRK